MDSEKFLLSIVDNVRRRESELGFSTLSPKEQVFLLVWSLEAEVNNGGFHQFFFNSAGDRFAETAEALRTIGAVQMAEIVDLANNVLGTQSLSPNRLLRQEQLESLTEDQKDFLSELDTRFYEYPENLSELLATYLRAEA
jgi:hypothetical protein